MKFGGGSDVLHSVQRPCAKSLFGHVWCMTPLMCRKLFRPNSLHEVASTTYYLVMWGG